MRLMPKILVLSRLEVDLGCDCGRGGLPLVSAEDGRLGEHADFEVRWHGVLWSFGGAVVVRCGRVKYGGPPQVFAAGSPWF